MSWLCQNWQGGRCYLKVSPKTRTLDTAFLRYPNLLDTAFLRYPNLGSKNI